MLTLILLGFGDDNILFMDETGFYQRQYYQYGWSPIGQPCHVKVDANKGKRVNLIAAMTLRDFELIAPVTFTGGCKRDFVEEWLDKLGQSLTRCDDGSHPKRFLVMDNARFHHGGDLKQIAEQYNICLIYLPPYSPDLNPIEQFWAVLKQKVRLLIDQFDSLQECVESCVL